MNRKELRWKNKTIVKQHVGVGGKYEDKMVK